MTDGSARVQARSIAALRLSLSRMLENSRKIDITLKRYCRHLLSIKPCQDRLPQRRHYV